MIQKPSICNDYRLSVCNGFNVFEEHGKEPWFDIVADPIEGQEPLPVAGRLLIKEANLFATHARGFHLWFGGPTNYLDLARRLSLPELGNVLATLGGIDPIRAGVVPVPLITALIVGADQLQIKPGYYPILPQEVAAMRRWVERHLVRCDRAGEGR